MNDLWDYLANYHQYFLDYPDTLRQGLGKYIPDNWILKLSKKNKEERKTFFYHQVTFVQGFVHFIYLFIFYERIHQFLSVIRRHTFFSAAKFRNYIKDGVFVRFAFGWKRGQLKHLSNMNIADCGIPDVAFCPDFGFWDSLQHHVTNI